MPLLERLKKFYFSDSFWAGLLRDAIFVVMVVGVFMSVSQIAFGLWMPMVAIESESMYPHMKIGDIVLKENVDRSGIITYMEGERTNYTSFENYGDVILYLPYGRQGATPIIHRAMYYVEKGEPMWKGGPPAPHAGYITKGDNSKTNPLYDQQGSISYLQPVKREWIQGVARFSPIPLAGCVTLTAKGNLVCFK